MSFTCSNSLKDRGISQQLDFIPLSLRQVRAGKVQIMVTQKIDSNVRQKKKKKEKKDPSAIQQ